MTTKSSASPGMPLRDYRVHRYVNAFCPECHNEQPDRPLAEVQRLSGWLADRDGVIYLERGCRTHGVQRTLQAVPQQAVAAGVVVRQRGGRVQEGPQSLRVLPKDRVEPGPQRLGQARPQQGKGVRDVQALQRLAGQPMDRHGVQQIDTGLHPGQRHASAGVAGRNCHLLGVSRQRCNAALKRLQAAGLLEIEYGGITGTDLEGLRRQVE